MWVLGYIQGFHPLYGHRAFDAAFGFLQNRALPIYATVLTQGGFAYGVGATVGLVLVSLFLFGYVLIFLPTVCCLGELAIRKFFKGNSVHP